MDLKTTESFCHVHFEYGKVQTGGSDVVRTSDYDLPRKAGGGEEGKEKERERERKKEAKREREREREREVCKREKRKKDQRIRDEGERYDKDSVNFGLENDQVILSFSF